MAKTNSEWVVEHQAAIQRIQYVLDQLVDRELPRLTDDLKKVSDAATAAATQQALAAATLAFTREIASVRELTTVMQAEFNQFRKQQEELDRKRFGLLGLIIGAMLTLVANVVVTWFKP